MEIQWIICVDYNYNLNPIHTCQKDNFIISKENSFKHAFKSHPKYFGIKNDLAKQLFWWVKGQIIRTI